MRWSSPVLQFARFATEDTEINGHPVAAGDKVGLFYCSANRDEAVFDEPGQFDLQRSPNPHLGFGGGGPHFCLGNQLAKTELRNLFRELLTRLKTVEFGEPDLLTATSSTASNASGYVRVGDIMRVEVDLDKCTGHGICESIAEDVFEVQDDGSVRSTRTNGPSPTVTGCSRP